MSSDTASVLPTGRLHIQHGSLIAAITLFAAIAPGVLLIIPAVAAQLTAQWQLNPAQIGNLIFAELGAMSLATLPAYWWQSRLNWRTVATASALLFIFANVASALCNDYSQLIICRIFAALAGGTLMIICISCAAGTANPSRTYSLWVLGQLVFGAVGLLILPPLFAHFGLMAVYLILAALMLCGLPLLRAFPTAGPAAATNSATSPPPSSTGGTKLLGILAVLSFYISISAIWAFIGSMTSDVSPSSLGIILSIATVCGIIGAVCASLISHRLTNRVSLWLGYLLLITSILLLFSSPQIARFTLAALLFKYTWTFVLPFILARLASLDSKLMNTINLVIGGGLAIGPLLAGHLISAFGGVTELLSGALVCTLVSFRLILLATPDRQFVNN